MLFGLGSYAWLQGNKGGKGKKEKKKRKETKEKKREIKKVTKITIKKEEKNTHKNGPDGIDVNIFVSAYGFRFTLNNARDNA